MSQTDHQDAFQKSGKWFVCIRICFLAFALFGPPPNCVAETVPPFVAKASVAKKLFQSGASAPYSASEATVIFRYSNGWWRVQSHVDAGSSKGLNTDCMKIVEGVRTYQFFGESTSKNRIEAEATPMTFPPPNQADVFAVWLMLCPSPELPVIDENRMHGFLTVAGEYSRLLSDPRNIGEYGVNYIEPESVFVRMLSFTNAGFALADRGYIGPYQHPFDSGFVSLRYEVLKTTNVNGFTFPIHAIFRRYVPNFPGTNRDDVSVSTMAEIVVMDVRTSETEQVADFQWKPALLAIDSRPAALPSNSVIGYAVTDDQWKPTSNPEIQRRVKAIPPAEPITPKLQNLLPRILLVITSILFLIILIGSQLKPNKQKT